MAVTPNELFSGNCEFIAGGVAMENLPPIRYPEIAFAGRSNVGKSSLINALVGKKIAHASSTPGRTRELNFFQLNDKLMLVDLPGYGYAKASRTEVAKWSQLVRSYLTGRPNLKRVYVLIDSRHGVKDTDEETMKALDDAAVSYLLTLTKTDKIKQAELEAVKLSTMEAIRRHVAALPYCLDTSAEKGDGLKALRGDIARLI